MPFIPLSEWDVSGQLSPYKQRKGTQLTQLLSGMIQGATKGVQDKQVRRAAANILGVPEEQIPLGMFKQEDLVDLQKEKFKTSLTPKEWKPTTKEEYLEAKRAEAGLKTASDTLKRVLGMQEKAATKGWELNVAPDLESTRQAEVARRLFTAKMAEPKKSNITPTTAIGILADPIKGPQIKRMYPQFYKRLEEIAREAIETPITKTPIEEPLNNNILDENW